MNPHQARELLRDIDRTVRYTLNGGNDPADPGDVRAAVAELANVLERVIHAITYRDS